MIINICEEVNKQETLYIVGTATLENNLRMPQKVKHGVVVCPRNSTPKYIAKEK
jgi:hypothetical protein